MKLILFLLIFLKFASQADVSKKIHANFSAESMFFINESDEIFYSLNGVIKSAKEEIILDCVYEVIPAFTMDEDFIYIVSGQIFKKINKTSKEVVFEKEISLSSKIQSFGEFLLITDSENNLICYTKDGDLVWKCEKFKDSSNSYIEIEVKTKDHYIYILKNKNLYILDIRNGELIKSVELNIEARNFAIFEDNFVVLYSSNQFCVVDLEDFKISYNFECFGKKIAFEENKIYIDSIEIGSGYEIFINENGMILFKNFFNRSEVFYLIKDMELERSEFEGFKVDLVITKNNSFYLIDNHRKTIINV